MGWLRLPGNVRVSDVASVIGRVLGQAGRLDTLGGGGHVANVEGVRVTSCDGMPECARITIGDHSSFLFHFEAPRGRRLIRLETDTRVGFAIGRTLADFFGGVLEDDYGETLIREPDKSDAMNYPSDGKPWADLQARILAVKPVKVRKAVRTSR